ncbi:MAG: carbohydrate-binding protein, partial [Fibrobacter sp.]|nr:carbohydrate-binding protein [Fibrobacter sp.]
KILITGNYVNIDWLDFFEEYTSVRPKFTATKTPVNYDVFDMLGSHVGRVDAFNVQEASQKARAIVKTGGSYYVKSKNGSAIIRVTK